jgi:hypothetical protein
MQKEHKKSLNEPLIKKESQEVKLTFIEKMFTNYWLLFAALGGIMFGSNNFLTDYSVKALDSYRVYCLTGFGMLTYFTLYHLTQAIRLYKQKGYFWSR